MSNETSGIGKRIWNYCNVLRDDGLSYQDYLEQLTYLLFLKMADELTKDPYNQPSDIPTSFDWQSLLKKDGEELERQYRNALERLGKEKTLVGDIFRKSQNKIQDPAKLKRLIELINSETWLALGVDVKGVIYEDLLERNAQDVKGGAGQYFTPRSLIKAMVEVMKPEPGIRICDPACGTGGFFLATYEFIRDNYKLDRDQKEFLKHKTISGVEIVSGVARLCIMNLFLHGLNGEKNPIMVADSLASEPSEHFDMVLTNPPFGKKSSVTFTTEEGEEDKLSLTYYRSDFWATTSNKQLNFVQHIKSLLKVNGRAAVVVPDNVLFEGGAGETVRRKLMQECDLHTILRLPTGIFYSQGVKANVIFFDRKEARPNPWTKEIWIYDLRTNKHFTLKTDPLKIEDLQDFIKCYNPTNRHQRQENERFKRFSYDEIMQRDKVSLDIFWLRDESLEDSANLPDPDVIAQEIADDLESALEQFGRISSELQKKPN